MEIMNINYDSKVFKLISSSTNGEVDDDVRFYYHQNKNILWGEYSGGPVQKGHILGTVEPSGTITFSYQHINMENEIQTGNCTSTPEITSDGKLRLHEKWQWTSGDKSSGTSIVEECES